MSQGKGTKPTELKEFDQILAPSAGKPSTSPVSQSFVSPTNGSIRVTTIGAGDLSCSINSKTGAICDDPSMPRWLQKKPSANQEQPLVANYSGQYDTYLEDVDATESNKGSPANHTEGPKEIEEAQKGTSSLSKNVSLYRGLFYSSMSSVFFSLSSVIVKYVDDISPGELAVLRFVGILIFTLPLVIYSREEPFGPKPSRHLLILRGLVGATSLFLRFVAFRYLPIADASVIVFSIPVFVSVLARIFLKEPCGFFDAFTVFLTLLGIVLLTKLPIIDDVISKNSPTYFYGISAALGSTVFGASVYVVIRKMTSVHHSIIMFNFGWVAILETTVLTFLTGEFTAPSCGFEQWLVILLGIFSFCGQMLLTLALKQENAGPVAVVRAATDIVLAFIWQIWFFNEIPDIYSISGAVLVSSCVVLISVRKWVMSLPEHSPTRKKFYLLTI